MMDFGALILAHLVGDFVLQNDWMANRKAELHRACALHVVLYTSAFVAIVALSGHAWPWWAYAIIAATHYPIDRYRLPRRAMRYTGQTKFATGPMAPWSVVAVDNTWHLLCAFAVWRLVEVTA